MNITRKNYQLACDGNPIRQFDFANNQHYFTLKDLALAVAREVSSDYSYDVDYDADGRHYLAINGVLCVRMTEGYFGESGHLQLNINRATKKDVVIGEIKKFAEAVAAAIQKMQDADFSIEIEIK